MVHPDQDHLFSLVRTEVHGGFTPVILVWKSGPNGLDVKAPLMKFGIPLGSNIVVNIYKNHTYFAFNHNHQLDVTVLNSYVFKFLLERFYCILYTRRGKTPGSLLVRGWHLHLPPSSLSAGNMMEVAAGPWTEVFEGSERTETSGRAETLLGSSTLTLAPLVADPPSVRRSQPIFISSSR